MKNKNIMRNNSEVQQQMFEVIERWKQSGLSQKSFCEKKSIKFYTFYYWYKRYRQQSQGSDSKPDFVKLKIKKTAAPTSVEIYFPDGVRLFFHQPVTPEYLKTLIR
jgi:hypothetical protein